MLLAIVFMAYCRDNTYYCKDSLFNTLTLKPIHEMTDYEYRHFREFHDECDQYDACNDVQLNFIWDKSVAEMSRNEVDYFEDIIFECDTFNPCKIKQYQELKDKQIQDYRNDELEFYEECKDECEDYVYNTCGKRRRRISLAFFGGAFAFISVGVVELITYKVNGPSCTSFPELGIGMSVTGSVIFCVSVPLLISGLKMKKSGKCIHAK